MASSPPSPEPQCGENLDMLQAFEKVNTKRNTRWSLKVWNLWKTEKMAKDPKCGSIPSITELADMPIPIMDEHLKSFVYDLKRSDGKEYPLDSLKSIVFGTRRFLKACTVAKQRPPLNIIGNHHEFPKFNKAFNDKRLIIERNEELAELSRKQAQTVSQGHEKTLWDRGILGCHSAKALSDSMYFYVSKIFGISSVGLRLLKMDHFTFSEDEHGRYVEVEKNFAKEVEKLNGQNFCRAHGLEVRSTETLRQYLDPENPRSFYNLILVYINAVARCQCDDPSFFIAPKEHMEFGQYAIGRNTLQQRCSRIMAEAEIEGHFTNQSLIQSVPALLLANGYNLKRKQVFQPEDHLAICKLLDPPSGILNTVEIQKQVLKLLSMSSSLPGAAAVTTAIAANNQLPLVMLRGADGNDDSEKQGSATDTRNIYHIQHPEKRQQQQFAVNSVQNNAASLCHTPGISYIESSSHLLPSVSRVNGSVSVAGAPNVSLINSTLPSHTISYSQVSDPSLRCVQRFSAGINTNLGIHGANKDLAFTPVVKMESVTDDEAFPSFLNPAADDNSNTSGLTDAFNEESGVDYVEVKTEPTDYDEFESCKTVSAAIDCERMEVNNGEYNANVSDTTVEQNRGKISESENSIPVKDSEKCDLNNTTASEGGSNCQEPKVATIRYCFKNDLVKNSIKQELTVTDDEQDVFAFSGTNKMGKTSSDLDLDLGEYLPEDCVIKPGDIQLKRIVTATGGEFVLNLKYSTK